MAAAKKSQIVLRVFFNKPIYIETNFSLENYDINSTSLQRKIHSVQLLSNQSVRIITTDNKIILVPMTNINSVQIDE